MIILFVFHIAFILLQKVKRSSLKEFKMISDAKNADTHEFVDFVLFLQQGNKCW